MTRFSRASRWLAALSLVASFQPAIAQNTASPGLVENLETWLDANSPWPRRETLPDIVVLPRAEPQENFGTAGYAGGTLRAYYDEDTAMIALVEPWDAANPTDQSILLHELAHHRQAAHHWFCAGAQELPAYKLQDAWAKEHGAEVRIDWISAVLESGCSRRDVHPD